MPPKVVNIPEVVQKLFEKTMEIMPDTTVNLANVLVDKIHELWTLKAKNAPVRKDGSPSLWGERYARTLKVEYASGNNSSAKVYADESSDDFMFVELVENGVTQWSIKDALLSGKAARRNAAKYGVTFVRVPFRWRVPGTVRQTSSFAGIMPQDVYELAKSGKTVGEEHGNLAGLRRVGGKRHGQFMTFRTVSQKSKGWIYPNISATPVFEDVSRKAEEMIAKALENFVRGFMKDMAKEGKKFK